MAERAVKTARGILLRSRGRAALLLRRIVGAFVAAVLVLALATPAVAQSRAPAPYANVQLPDPAKEAKATALMATLRCLVCQGQAIVDSDADMAGDMRSLVRQRIAAGESADEVRDWLIARYGDYVTYDPPMSAVTIPLWLTPLALLGLGIWIASASFRRRRPPRS
ncbi:cytochrome c-type biogenesis protein [Sphingomonas sp. IC4-52]|uniref:cytochrome c-type biogenesis protein n=1 Tax=Sphingomonas sp. IC4-52 TaxID=2887202 RepID=UPI002AB1095C|nr:cytochrome c-type biogenesis protein [Sphingomonas sp. IC4-52]